MKLSIGSTRGMDRRGSVCGHDRKYGMDGKDLLKIPSFRASIVSGERQGTARARDGTRKGRHAQGTASLQGISLQGMDVSGRCRFGE